jgi:hypothetical protein
MHAWADVLLAKPEGAGLCQLLILIEPMCLTVPSESADPQQVGMHRAGAQVPAPPIANDVALAIKAAKARFIDHTLFTGMATGRIYLESGVGRLPGWHRESAATPDNRGLEILRPAANLEDAPALIEAVVASVGIGLELAAKVGQQRRRAIALMRARRVEDDLLREGIQIGPDASFETPPRSSSTVIEVSSVCR